MITIHLVLGEKGGVGKSQVALSLATRYFEQSLPVAVCEADRSNGDVGRACEGKAGYVVYRPYFTEDSDQTDKADGLLDAVLAKGTDGIVNCPAQSYRALAKWLNQGSADLAVEAGVRFVFWFVTNGEYDSMMLFINSLEEFGHIPHVLVRNTYFTDRLTYDYSDPERNPTIKQVIEKYTVGVVDFPRFAPADLDSIKSHNLTFSEALEAGCGLTIAARSRVKRALSTFFTQTDTLEVFNHADRTQATESGTNRKPTSGQKRRHQKTGVGDPSQNQDFA